MLRIISGVLVAATLAQPAVATVAAKDHAKRHPKVVWHGYGFLPGYRPPDTTFMGDPGSTAAAGTAADSESAGPKHRSARTGTVGRDGRFVAPSDQSPAVARRELTDLIAPDRLDWQ
jgi:hypothetical protein